MTKRATCVFSIVLSLALGAPLGAAPVTADVQADNVATSRAPEAEASLLGCLTFPSQGTCDFKDPSVEGCEADAVTLASAQLDGKIKIALRYSAACRTAWARGQNLSGLAGSSVFAQINRYTVPSGGSPQALTATVATMPATIARSNMLFASGFYVEAVGTLQDAAGNLTTIRTNRVLR